MTKQERLAGWRHSAAMLLWALWFGGLTFYAAFVVPIGTDQIGSVGQGLITQQVTIRLNGIAVIFLGFWLWDGIASRTWRHFSFGLWVLQAAVLVLLALLHWKMSGLLNLEDATADPPSGFYGWHRAYLILTTIQWLIGLVMGLAALQRNQTKSD